MKEKRGGGGGGRGEEEKGGVGGESSTGLKKGPWTAAEDSILAEYVRKHGDGNWNSVQRHSGLSRCGKSCRLRWANHLRPNLKKGSFSPEEELLIARLHAQLGNKWARMATELPGRTDNEIKNYWNTRKKRRERAGISVYPTAVEAAAAAPSPGADRKPNLTIQPVTFFDPSSIIAFAVSPAAGSSAPPLHCPPHYAFAANPMTAIYGTPPIPPLYRRHQHAAAAAAVYGFDPRPVVHPFPLSAPSARPELPSSQFFAAAAAGGDLASPCSDCEPPLRRCRSELILDALMQQEESRGGLGDCSSDIINGSPAPPDHLHRLAGELDQKPPNLVDVKMENVVMVKDEFEITTGGDPQEGISSLFGMIPATPMPDAAVVAAAGEWSSGVVNEDDDSELVLQQLAMPLLVSAAEEQSWSIGSSPWDSMPEIC